MNIYHRPYTYLIGWSKLNTFYYGVRYAKKCVPEDLWVSYHTSSYRVTNFRLENGEPDIIQVRKIFSSSSEARLWEHKVLRRMKVIQDPRFLNRTDNIAILLDDVAIAKRLATLKKRNYKPSSHNLETRMKISKANKGKLAWNKGLKNAQPIIIGRKLSEESKEKIRQSKLGKKQSFESNLKRSETQKGVPHTKEHNEKVRIGKLRYEEHKRSMNCGTS